MAQTKSFSQQYPTYQRWMRAVDILLGSRIGLSTEDLADRDYRDEYDAGYLPAQCVERVLEENGLTVEKELFYDAET